MEKWSYKILIAVFSIICWSVIFTVKFVEPFWGFTAAAVDGDCNDNRSDDESPLCENRFQLLISPDRYLVGNENGWYNRFCLKSLFFNQSIRETMTYLAVLLCPLSMSPEVDGSKPGKMQIIHSFINKLDVFFEFIVSKQ